MNNFSFTGNLGKDAEKRVMANGDAIVSLSVPCKAGFGDKAVTTWLRCTLWGKRGESVYPYLTKGALVGITGEFSAREYSDNDGVKRTSLEVRVNDLTLLGGKRDEAPAPQAAAPARTLQSTPMPANTGGFESMDDDVPFTNPMRGSARCLAM